MALNQAQQSAFDLMNQTLASWGLGSLGGDLKKLIVGGDTSSDTLSLALSETPAYKARFSANVARQKAGLPELSPAQYIATEEQYRNVLSQYGLPKGFYDTPSALSKFIASDVSPTELDTRAKIAQQQFIDAPAEMKNYWGNYGLSQGQAVASILDPNHESLATLQSQANAVSIGGTAAQNGVNVAGQRALQLAGDGVTLAGAQKAYETIGQYGQRDNATAQRFGSTLSQTDQENALLLNNADAVQKQDLVFSEEGAQFAGHGGADTHTGTSAANY